MSRKRSKEAISYNMSRIRSKGTRLEQKLEEILKLIDNTYVKQPKILGKPDFAYTDLKIAIFADSDFWHGYNWEEAKNEIHTNQEFWIKKIERNIKRDDEVNQALRIDDWAVLRFWEHDIVKHADKISLKISDCIKSRREVIV